MKLDSPLFNRIRVKPEQDRKPRGQAMVCDWPGCEFAATHRAPKGRMREREYWRFCLEHVREYNHSYNYFSGMSDDAVMRYQKDAVTGHRPTWKMGTGNRPAGSSAEFGPHAQDPFNVFREIGAKGADARTRPEPQRTVRKAEIKARFKILVKRHHPDANGGDRATEDKLREIIQAYNYLKSVGAC